MTGWLLAAAVLLVALVPALVRVARGDLVSRVVGLQHASAVVALVLLLVGAGTASPFPVDVALLLVALSTPGTLLFARYAERWLEDG